MSDFWKMVAVSVTASVISAVIVSYVTDTELVKKLKKSNARRRSK